MTTVPASTGRLLSGWWLLPALFLMLSGTVASNQALNSRRLVIAAVLAGLATLALVTAPRRPVAAGLVAAACSTRSGSSPTVDPCWLPR